MVEPSYGYEHLLVKVDHFTKFACVVLTKNESSRTTAKALYMPNRCVDDATATLLHKMYLHTDRACNYSRVMFIDFSSAFNTIQPHILLQKLCKMDVNPYLIRWIYEYLSNRVQYVKLQTTVSDKILTSTGAPQGCVLSPLLFSLYTNDCIGHDENCLLLKYADDTVIIGNIRQSDETLYRATVSRFVSWCEENYLHLNVCKTKEMIVGFGKGQTYDDIHINGQKVETVNKYKYLGTIIDDRLTMSANVHNLYAKGVKRMNFVRLLSKLQIDKFILTLFYRSILESVITFGIVCWFNNTTKKDLHKLERIVKMASKFGIPTTDLHSLYTVKLSAFTNKVMQDSNHPL